MTEKFEVSATEKKTGGGNGCSSQSAKEDSLNWESSSMSEKGEIDLKGVLEGRLTGLHLHILCSDAGQGGSVLYLPSSPTYMSLLEYVDCT